MGAWPIDAGRRVYREARQRRREQAWRRRREEIDAILGRPDPPRALDSEDQFGRLQSEYDAFERGQYTYDAATLWWRGCERTRDLIDRADLREPGARILEVACGDGMVGHAMDAYGHHATLTDVEDWRDDRARGLPFVLGSIDDGLPLESGSFDVVCSYYAFIHFLEPARSLSEMVRLCRGGGLIYLEFGNLYPSPWGMHLYRTIKMPYCQYLFSRPFLDRKLRELGQDVWPAGLGRREGELIPLNGWTLGQYERLWEESGCEVVSTHAATDESHLGVIERFPGAFTGRGLGYQDVTTRMTAVLLRTP